VSGDADGRDAVSRHNRSTPSNAGLTKPGVGIFTPSSAVALLALAGVVLRLWHYLSNNSLWKDEAALARNIVERSALELLGPLNHVQVAPPGFLLIEKGIVGLAGSSELALRLFPCLCAIAAIAVFWRVASWTLTGWAVPYALGLFALASPLIDFSAQVKQYSSDALTSVVVVWAALWQIRQPSDMRRATIVATVGAGAAWLSQPAVFVLGGAGIALAVAALRERRRDAVKAVILIAAAWGLSAGLASALAVRNVTASDRGYLKWFWTEGFMPSPLGGLADLLWVWDRLGLVFGVFGGARRTNGGLGYPWSWLFVVFLAAGYLAFWRRSRETALVLLLPMLATLTAAALHLYPFTGRGVSFLLPAILLTTAAGVHYAITHLPLRLQFGVPVLLAVSVGAPLFAALATSPPERMQHLRPVLESVAARKQHNDVIYVYYEANRAFMYYAPRFDTELDRVVFGRCSVHDPRGYLRDHDQVRGQARVWVVTYGAPEVMTLTGYLDAIGVRLESIEVRAKPDRPMNAAYAFLYDLSDPQRFANASAETYPVLRPPVRVGLERWGCYPALADIRTPVPTGRIRRGSP
jgi:hypothetical protein